MKKLLSLGITLVLGVGALSLFPACGGTAEVEYSLSDDGTYYIVSGVSGNKSALTEYEVAATYLNTETGEELPVKEIGYEAFQRCTSLYEVTLPEGIEKIGERAFAFCALHEITLPQSLTEISRAAFGMCEGLTEVVIPENVTILGIQAFAYCTRLEKVYIKAQLTELLDYTFVNSVATSGSNYYTNTALTEVYLPASMQKICSSALSGNYISDIYFAGTDEQWDSLYFYENSTDDDGNKTENKLEKSSLLSAVAVHTNYNF
jgi:hypothetical protein